MCAPRRTVLQNWLEGADPRRRSCPCSTAALSQSLRGYILGSRQHWARDGWKQGWQALSVTTTWVLGLLFATVACVAAIAPGLPTGNNTPPPHAFSLNTPDQCDTSATTDSSYHGSLCHGRATRRVIEIMGMPGGRV